MNAATTPTRFTMVGPADVLACEGDTCFMPAAKLPDAELPDEAPETETDHKDKAEIQPTDGPTRARRRPGTSRRPSTDTSTAPTWSSR